MNPTNQIYSLHAKMQKRLSLYEKRSVVQRAIEMGIRPCTRQCDVHPSIVYRWLQQEHTMEHIPGRRRKTLDNIVTLWDGAKYPDCEQELSR